MERTREVSERGNRFMDKEMFLACESRKGDLQLSGKLPANAKLDIGHLTC